MEGPYRVRGARAVAVARPTGCNAAAARLATRPPPAYAVAMTRSASLLLLLLSGPLASGHVGAEWATLDQERPGMVEAEFGLLVESGEDPTPWAWTCHEAITQPDALLTPRYAAGPDTSGHEVVLAALADPEQARDLGRTLYRSVDLCDWTPADGLPEAPVTDMVFLGPDRVVAASVGTDEVGLTLHLSTDAGATWTPAEAPSTGAGRTLLTLQPDGDGGAWGASFRLDDPDAIVLHSTLDGQTWTARAVPLTELGISLPDDQPAPARVLAADEEQVWLGIGDPRGHVVLATADGGMTWSEVLRVDGTITDGAIDENGELWMLEAGRAVWHSADGADFVRIDDVPTASGLAAAEDGGVVLATGELATGALTFHLDKDGIATPALRSRNLQGPLDCPAGTDHTEICAPLWFITDVPQPIEPVDPPPPPDPPPDPGCACTPSPSMPSLLGGGLLLTALLRRRRSSGRPRIDRARDR